MARIVPMIILPECRRDEANIMRSRGLRFSLIVSIAGIVIVVTAPRADAQSDAGARSLGGYGATSPRPMSLMGSGTPAVPYAGAFGGFMPYRMSNPGLGALSFTPRASAMIDSPRTSFSLAPMSGSMTSGPALRLRGLNSLESWPTGRRMNGSSMSPLMDTDRSGRVTPPNFGYPFYQPPSFLSPAAGFSGMSM